MTTDDTDHSGPDRSATGRSTPVATVATPQASCGRCGGTVLPSWVCSNCGRYVVAGREDWKGPFGDEARCDRCGGANPAPWFADNAVWNVVMGGPDARDDPGGFLCPTCFLIEVRAMGLGDSAKVELSGHNCLDSVFNGQTVAQWIGLAPRIHGDSTPRRLDGSIIWDLVEEDAVL